MADVMRTHAEIIQDAGGWRALRDALGLPTDDARVKFWYFRNSIPCDYWQELTRLSDAKKPDKPLTDERELAEWPARRRYLKERAA